MPNLANIQTFQQHYHIDINGNSKILEIINLKIWGYPV